MTTSYGFWGRARAWLAALLLLTPLPGLAQTDGQYYLVAGVAPEGSLTAGGQARRLVYLRWDPLEGELPPSVASIRLLRNGEVVMEDKAVHAVMAPGEIEQLYSGPAQQRRLLEMVLRLQAEALDNGAEFSAGDFATAIWRLINPALPPVDDGGPYDYGWALFASRSDINVARARYRAYVDDPGSGQFRYELLAVSASGSTALLGRADVNTTQQQQLLGAGDFRQVFMAQCDLPESGKDHHSVALHWHAAGVGNPTDELAAQIYLSGYDLYRTTAKLGPEVTVAPPRNIAQEAAAAGHDTYGRPLLAGLELVNDTLLTVTPDNPVDPADPVLAGFADRPEWLETQDELARAGLMPGDRRAYYLVPRDFTGNYGPTAATIVVVPNLLRPPAPWDLRSVVDNVSAGKPGGLALSWNAVNLTNYVDAHQHGRVFCNLPQAATTGVLEFVGRGESCAVDVRRRVRVDATDYLVYRFPDFDSASRFQDSDGDGVSDADEREAGGTQCDLAARPAGRPNYLLQASLNEVVLPQSNRVTVRVLDTTLGAPAEQGEVHWYRVAARTPDGMLSHLSAPERGLYPDRDLPPPPIMTVQRPNPVIDGCELVVDNPTSSWGFSDQVRRGSLVATCPNLKGPQLLTVRSTAHGSAQCQAIRHECGGNLNLTYYNAATGSVMCEINLPQDLPPEDAQFNFCDVGQARLVPTYGLEDVPAEAGDIALRIVTYEFLLPPDAPAGSCIDVYDAIDDTGPDSRMESSCGAVTAGPLIYEPLSGYSCPYAVTKGPNNRVSRATKAPCVAVDSASAKLPTTPQPVSLTPLSATAEVSWRLPVEPVAVTLISLEHKHGAGVSNRELITVANAGSGSGEVSSHSHALPPLAGDSDEICVRFQAIAPRAAGATAAVSAWSAPLCAFRRAQGSVLPSYLPWPGVEAALQGPPLEVGIEPALSFLGTPALGVLFFDVTALPPEKDLVTQCLEVGGDGGANLLKSLLCNERGRNNVHAFVGAETPFVVYRQRRTASGEPGDWIQVSPLIEYAHFDIVPPDTVGRDRRLNDPFIQLRLAPGTAAVWRLAFTDRYPYGPGEYRYQLVHFDREHRITYWRRSDWITYPAGG